MLVLASASPRRRELLTQAGFTFQVHPAHIPEDPLPNEDPIAYVTRLAREKAQAVFDQLTMLGAPEPVLSLPKDLASETWESAKPDSASSPVKGTVSGWKGTGLSPYIDPPKEAGALAPEGMQTEPLAVLGADTTVTLDNQILGKPESPADAARMLRLLSGRTHRVITGVAIVTPARTEVAAEVTAVKFLTLSEAEIEAYIATGEPMDKAGAYAIQGRAARWIPRIEGDYFNVVGLPIALVSTLLESIF
jgi:septum formation protein